MQVNRFDIQEGIYQFETEHLDTALHAHPAVEILMAEEGSFSLQTPHTYNTQVRFAIIDSQALHQIKADHSRIKILLLESYNTLLPDLLKQLGMLFTDGVYIATTTQMEVYQQLLDFGNEQSLQITPDQRVNTCLQAFRNQDLEYHQMIASLQAVTFLSESRLSHLFKEYVGVSLKKYLVWTKLKKTIAYLLQAEANLTQSSLQAGFYDQAHFTRAFKKHLGITPSKAYNSRTLQFLFPSE
ncbi:MAG TPA: hypothetical protein DCS93_01690 [Microscillaceae bacterium]|nr:hypothetical protein [Microscillaceae bacterium]